MYNKNKYTQLGFSALQVVVYIATLAALFRVAIPNLNEFNSRAYNTRSLYFFRELKEYANFLSNSDSLNNIAIFNQASNDKFYNLDKFGLKGLKLPEGVILKYAIFLNNDTDKIQIFEVSSKTGTKSYRFIKIGSEILEQEIKK